jgi:hypothetical protein
VTAQSRRPADVHKPASGAITDVIHRAHCEATVVQQVQAEQALPCTMSAVLLVRFLGVLNPKHTLQEKPCGWLSSVVSRMLPPARSPVGSHAAV